MKLKNIFAIIILLGLITKSYCQNNCSDTLKIEKIKRTTNNIVGSIPSDARVINGLTIGWSGCVSDFCESIDSVRINGLYINASPFQPIVGVMGLTMMPFKLLSKDANEDTSYFDLKHDNYRLNGVSIGLIEMGDRYTVQGFQFTALFHFMGKLNGLSISLFTSDYKQFNGVMISGIFNKSDKGRGLQIGLINSSKKMKGVQIGLWNKIGDSAFPLINMRFKKEI